MFFFLFFLNIIWCNGLLLCIPLSSSTPTQNDVISKLCTCAISLSIYLSLCKLLPVERCIEEDFVNSTPFYLQVIYLYVAMLALRPKYYFVWTFGELVIIVNTSPLATPYKKSNLAVWMMNLDWRLRPILEFFDSSVRGEVTELLHE